MHNLNRSAFYTVMVISSALSRSRKINEVKFIYDLMMLEGSASWMTGGGKKSHRKNERER